MRNAAQQSQTAHGAFRWQDVAVAVEAHYADTCTAELRERVRELEQLLVDCADAIHTQSPMQTNIAAALAKDKP
jgi:hypothetical protein